MPLRSVSTNPYCEDFHVLFQCPAQLHPTCDIVETRIPGPIEGSPCGVIWEDLRPQLDLEGGAHIRVVAVKEGGATSEPSEAYPLPEPNWLVGVILGIVVVTILRWRRGP